MIPSPIVLLTVILAVTQTPTHSFFLAERYTYDSFGTPTIRGTGPDNLMDTGDDIVLPQSSLGNLYFFAGREFDFESGLSYNRHRYWDPRTGRFLQEDPLGLMAGPNLYIYVLNNPLNLVDPFGLEQQRRNGLKYIEGLGWIAVGAAVSALDGPMPIADAGGAVAVGYGVGILQGTSVSIAVSGAVQVSQASAVPEAYPGQARGKAVRELRKAQECLRYGGPQEEVQLFGPLKPKGFWEKVIFYTAHVLRAYSRHE